MNKLLVIAAISAITTATTSAAYITEVTRGAPQLGLSGPDSASFPIDTSVGVGKILDPIYYGGVSDFALHNNYDYTAPNVPNPSVAVVTYQFNTPAVVNALELVQHVNGITKIEGFVGNDLSTMVSIGNVFSELGDLPSGYGLLTEGSMNTFNFNNTSLSGTYFKFVITKTSLDWGFANYRAYPVDAFGNRYSTLNTVPVPEPATYLAGLTALGMLGLFSMRTRK